MLINVVTALAPIPVGLFWYWIHRSTVNVSAVIRDAQLCFYSTTLCAAALSDSAKSTGDFRFAQASMILCLVVASASWGVGLGAPQDPTTDRKLAIASIAAALATTIVVVVARKNHGLL